jgi:hypothetical protein
VYKKQWIHLHLQDILDKKIGYDEISIYLKELDVNLLYPYLMFIGEFLTGECYWCMTGNTNLAIYQAMMENIQSFENEFPASIWEVEFDCLNNLIVPVLPCKKEVRQNEKTGEIKHKGLVWTLEPREGVYTLIDLIQARKRGYWIKLKKGLVWAKKERIFKDYIDLVYQMKKEGDEKKNEALRALGKLMLNRLFGKFLQAALLDGYKIACSHEELADFMLKYKIVDWNIVYGKDGMEDAGVFSGIAKDVEAQITKLPQIGAFILSYSRWVMQDIMDYVDKD